MNYNHKKIEIVTLHHYFDGILVVCICFLRGCYTPDNVFLAQAIQPSPKMVGGKSHLRKPIREPWLTTKSLTLTHLKTFNIKFCRINSIHFPFISHPFPIHLPLISHCRGLKRSPATCRRLTCTWLLHKEVIADPRRDRKPLVSTFTSNSPAGFAQQNNSGLYTYGYIQIHYYMIPILYECYIYVYIYACMYIYISPPMII